MNERDVDLLPHELRERVHRTKSFGRSCRTALALTMVAAVAAVCAEALRLDAMASRDELERTLEDAQATDEAQRRLVAELAALQSASTQLQVVNADVPASSVISALSDSLPRGARLERIALHDVNGFLEGEVLGISGESAAAMFATMLASTRPFERVTLGEVSIADGRCVVRFAVPNDRAFLLVTDASASDKEDEDGH